MIKGGKGGANTLSGLRFEKRTDLKYLLEENNYRVKEQEVYYGSHLENDILVGRLLGKNKLYTYLREKHCIEWEDHLSKKLLPDNALLVENTERKCLYIIECKFQSVAGSVDEKLQTCDFKLKQYKKLLEKTGIEVHYIYVLNQWFRKPEYEDVRAYIEKSGCRYYYDVIPLQDIGLDSSTAY